MKNNVSKQTKSMEELFDFVNRAVSNNSSRNALIGNKQHVDDNKLQILREFIYQVRQNLELLIIKSEVELIDKEVLEVSRELDELISGYQKAIELFEESNNSDGGC